MNLADFAWSERSRNLHPSDATNHLAGACYFHSLPTSWKTSRRWDTVIKNGRSSYRSEPFSSTVREARRNEAPPTFNSFQLAWAVTKGLAELKTPKNVQKYCQESLFLNVHYTATVRSFCHSSSAGWLCPCQRGWRFTGPRKYWNARFWDGATLGGGLLGCASFGASANEISTCAIGLRSVGECCSSSSSSWFYL